MERNRTKMVRSVTMLNTMTETQQESNIIKIGTIKRLARPFIKKILVNTKI